MNTEHEANRRYWNRAAESWFRLREADGTLPLLKHQPELGFAAGTYELINKYIKKTSCARACVIGSGDNYAAFSLASMGMQVTSVDISEQQLFYARKRAAELGLRISFVCADATDLHAIDDCTFDLVCTTNGFFVWIGDLRPLFKEIARLLGPDGVSISYDIHPFQRPWANDNAKLLMDKSYFETAPLPPRAVDDSPTYEHHWMISDILNAIAAAGLMILEIQERQADDASFWEGYSYRRSPDQAALDWHKNPRAGLPVWLSIASRKTRVQNPG